MLSKNELLSLNRRMISLGEPVLRDDIGYNKPDFVFCHQFLSHIDDYEAYLLSKRLKKYLKTQLVDYEKEVKDTIKEYDKLYKKNRNLSYKRGKNKKFVDVSFEKDFAYVYVPTLPPELKRYYSYEEKGSKLVKVNYEDLLSFLKVLNLFKLTTKRSAWKEVKNRNLKSSDLLERIIVSNKKEQKEKLEFEKRNQRLTKGNEYIINVIEDDKENQLLTLEYPRNKFRSRDVIYQGLKFLDYNDRVYYGDKDFGDYKLKYSGIKSFLSFINNYNSETHEDLPFKINATSLEKYLSLCNNSFSIKVVEYEEYGGYLISFPYNNEIINTIKELPSNSRSYINKSWLISENMLSKLYFMLKEVELEDKELDLSDFEKYIDLEKINSKEINILIRHISGQGNNKKYQIDSDIYNEEVEKVLNSFIIYFNKNGIKEVYITDFPDLITKLKDISDFKVNTKELEEEIIKYQQDISNKVFPMIDIANIEKKPFPYQETGIKEMLKLKRFILGDEMGLGKSLQMIIWGLSYPYKKLLVVPKCLKLNWEKEILEIDPSQEINVITKGSYKKLTTNNGWVIINYDILKKYYDDLKEENFKVIGIDEAHLIKSVKVGGKPNSKRAELVLDLLQDIPFRALITGTPISNKTKDIWNLLVAIEHPLSRKFFSFAERYCDAETTDYGYCFDGSSNQQELYEELSPYMIRRLKKDVLDLPEKIRTFIPNEINLKAYNKKLDEYMEDCKGSLSSAAHLVYLNALRYILANEKIKSTIEIAENILEQDEPVVIYTNFTTPALEFKEYFGDNAVIVTGQTKESDRNEAVEKFQNGEVNVFIGNVKAAGVGITLTRSNNLVFNDYDWLPSNHVQAEDRLHRISQTRVCNIFYNYASNTEVDLDMTSLINYKLKNISSTIDGQEDEFMNFSMFKEIVKKFDENIE